jgi:hypothetical protein
VSWHSIGLISECGLQSRKESINKKRYYRPLVVSSKRSFSLSVDCSKIFGISGVYHGPEIRPPGHQRAAAALCKPSRLPHSLLAHGTAGASLKKIRYRLIQHSLAAD